MSDDLRIVCGGRWTVDGRWVVVGTMMEGGPEVILFDPANGMEGPDDTELAWIDLHDCFAWIRDVQQGVHGRKG